MRGRAADKRLISPPTTSRRRIAVALAEMAFQHVSGVKAEFTLPGMAAKWPVAEHASHIFVTCDQSKVKTSNYCGKIRLARTFGARHKQIILRSPITGRS